MGILTKKYYLCGTCGSIYSKAKIPEIKKTRNSKTPRCCKKPLQIISKEVKEEIENRNLKE